MQSNLRLSLSTLFLAFVAQLSPSQTVRLTNPGKADVPSPAPQHFVCNTRYSAQQCHEQISVLRPLLDRYGAGRLGDWIWVLVKSDDWKELQRAHRMDPDSPAFTVLDRRETFFEEALVSPVTERRIELVRQWSLGMDDLLELAVTHELGRARAVQRKEREEGGRLRRGASKGTDCHLQVINKPSHVLGANGKNYGQSISKKRGRFRSFRFVGISDVSTQFPECSVMPVIHLLSLHDDAHLRLQTVPVCWQWAQAWNHPIRVSPMWATSIIPVSALFTQKGQ